MMRWMLLAIVAGLPLAALADDPARGPRLHPAGMPDFDQPVAFDNPAADAILAALEVFPEDNPSNQVVSAWPLHPDSAAIIASIGTDKPLRYNPDMSFVIVPPGQPLIEVELVGYPDESDPGPFPIPDAIPIEGWPAGYARDPRLADLSLDDVQRDTSGLGGDRNGIVVDPVNRRLHEFFELKKTDAGWTATCAATFDLSANELRPDGWTSADAAGLPIFPAVIRHDELHRGAVEHALRVTVRKTRRGHAPPATHHASRLTDETLPRMGERRTR